MNKRMMGSCYERMAAAYLKENYGYKILEMNYKCRFGEIDIIAMDGNFIVFIEVKYRTNLTKGHPLESIGARKQKKIYEVAKYYIVQHNEKVNRPCRFDAISFHGEEITYVKNIFGGL
ncbi:MAG: YraN family protein [Lachnospiraceae bacterium]